NQNARPMGRSNLKVYPLARLFLGFLPRNLCNGTASTIATEGNRVVQKFKDLLRVLGPINIKRIQFMELKHLIRSAGILLLQLSIQIANIGGCRTTVQL